MTIEVTKPLAPGSAAAEPGSDGGVDAAAIDALLAEAKAIAAQIEPNAPRADDPVLSDTVAAPDADLDVKWQEAAAEVDRELMNAMSAMEAEVPAQAVSASAPSEVPAAVPVDAPQPVDEMCVAIEETIEPAGGAMGAPPDDSARTARLRLLDVVQMAFELFDLPFMRLDQTIKNLLGVIGITLAGGSVVLLILIHTKMR
jgi:hypothetical protein